MLRLKLKSDNDKGASPVRLKQSNKSADKPANPVRIRLRTNKTYADGYDVEAPDREEDPTVEEAVVLRMLPNCEGLKKLQKYCESNDFSKLQIRFEDRRHALVTVDGEEFHALLMDLPTITEVHKTVDRRNIFKTVDVSQILLVTHKHGSPAPDIRQLMKFTGDPQAFPHGLTPPLHNVRNRRFQKHMSTKAVESLEAQVEELLRKDAAAKEVKTEMLPASAIATQQALADATRVAAQAQADESDMDVDDELDEELERAMMDDEEEDAEEEEEVESETGVDGQASDDEEDDDDDDDDEDEDEDRAAGGRDDEDDDERHHNKQLREEIRELHATIDAKEKVAGTVVNDIMRARHMDAVTRLRAELEKKKSLLRDADGPGKHGSVEPDENDVFAGDEEEEDDLDDEEDIGDISLPAPSSQLTNEPDDGQQPQATVLESVPDEADRHLEAQLGEQLGDAMLEEDDDIDSLF